MKLFIYWHLFCSLVFIYSHLNFVWVDASPGDQTPAFQSCLKYCIRHQCPTSWFLPLNTDDIHSREMEEEGDKDKKATENEYPVTDEDRMNPEIHNNYPWYLTLLGWSCEDECKYHCMQSMVSQTRRRNALLNNLRQSAIEEKKLNVLSSIPEDDPIHQYYGKWPFIRIFGIQELASVIFSIGNLLGHCYGFRYYQRRVSAKHPSFYMVSWMNRYFSILVATWVSAAIYHMRDTKWTEVLDYYFAFLSMVAALFIALLTVFKLHSSGKQLFFFIPLFFLFLYHICILSFYTFDYGYNMKMNIIVGIAYLITWIFWLSKHWNKPHAALLVIFLTGLMSAAMFEVFDFPPWKDLVDAHALWHATSAPFAFLWYVFLAKEHLSSIKTRLSILDKSA